MSMDLSVWTGVDVHLPNSLPRASEWQTFEGEWVFEGNGWQILVIKGDESPDEQIRRKFPAALHVIYVALEPVGADSAGYKMAEEVVRSLAKTGGGVWVSPDGTAYFCNEGMFREL